MVRKSNWAWLFLCCAALTACGEAPQPSINVQHKVLTVALTNASLQSLYSAKITGQQSVEIRPQVGGVITRVCIAEGAEVKRGQSLFIIDQVPYQAALQTALANVENAQAQVSTATLMVQSKEELRRQNVVSDFDLLTSRNDLLMAKAALAQAKAMEVTARNNLSYTVVKSPVDGVAGMIPFRVGALVSSSMATPLVQVSDDAQMYAYFSITENQLLSLSRGSEGGDSKELLKAMPQVQLRLSDGTMYEHPGTIDAISGIIDASTGAVSVRATFPNKNRVLRSGGSGSVVMPYEKVDCVVIPQAATFEVQDKVFTYRVVDGKASATPITIFGVDNGREYVVESGLAPGDVIVAEGAGLLREGTPITLPTTKN